MPTTNLNKNDIKAKDVIELYHPSGKKHYNIIKILEVNAESITLSSCLDGQVRTISVDNPIVEFDSDTNTVNKNSVKLLSNEVEIVYLPGFIIRKLSRKYQ